MFFGYTRSAMFSLSNILTLTRAPLALAFLSSNVYLRLAAIALAMLTDTLDGYLARRTHTTTRLGTILDPLMDKFFVYFAITVFFINNQLSLLNMVFVLSRDFSLIILRILHGSQRQEPPNCISGDSMGKSCDNLATACSYWTLFRDQHPYLYLLCICIDRITGSLRAF